MIYSLPYEALTLVETNIKKGVSNELHGFLFNNFPSFSQDPENNEMIQALATQMGTIVSGQVGNLVYFSERDNWDDEKKVNWLVFKQKYLGEAIYDYTNYVIQILMPKDFDPDIKKDDPDDLNVRERFSVWTKSYVQLIINDATEKEQSEALDLTHIVGNIFRTIFDNIVYVIGRLYSDYMDNMTIITFYKENSQYYNLLLDFLLPLFDPRINIDKEAILNYLEQYDDDLNVGKKSQG